MTTFYGNDVLARFLIDRLHLTPIKFALISIAVAVVYGLIFSWIGGVLMTFLQDWTVWIWQLFFIPILMGYYLWGSNAMAGIIQDLRKSNTVEISDSDVSVALRLYLKPSRIILSCVAAVISSALYFMNRSDVASSWTSDGIPRITSTIGFAVGAYMVSMLIFTLLMNIYVLRQILNNKEFHIDPLNPDRCGGLKALSEYSLKTAYLAAVFGLAIVLTLYRFKGTDWYYWLMLGVPFYIAVASLCFFAPLMTAHRKMMEAKEKLLSNIARQFKADNLHAQEKLNGDAQKLKDAVEKVQQTQTLYDLTDQFPVWPFNITTLQKFFISLTTPLAASILGLLFDILKSRLIPK